MKRLLLLFLLFAWGAQAQPVVGPCMNNGPCSATIMTGQNLTLTGPGTALSVTNNAAFATSGTQVNITSGQIASVASSLTLAGPGVNGQQLILAPGSTHGSFIKFTDGTTNQAHTAAANGNWSWAGSVEPNKQLTGLSGALLGPTQSAFYGATNITGTINSGTEAAPYAFVISSDQTDSHTVSNGISGLLIQYNWGDASNPAVTSNGGRNGLRLTMTQVGPNIGRAPPVNEFFTALLGSVKNGYNDGGVDTSATGSGGALFGLNTATALQCTDLATACATNYRGAVGYEADITLRPNVSLYRKVGVNVVTTPGSNQMGSGIDSAFEAAGVSPGWANIIYSGAEPNGTNWFLDPEGGQGNIVYLYPGDPGAVTRRPLLHALDVAAAQFNGSVIRSTHYSEWDLGVSGITGATRLTTNGQAAGNLTGVRVTHGSTGYSGATGTISGCSSTPTVTPNVITDSLGGGSGIIGTVTVNTVGGGCVNPTISFTGGSGALATAFAADNSIALQPNSASELVCRVTAYSAAADAISWSIDFLASQGANAAATAIVGSPSWTQVAASAGAAAKISIAAPTADTTLGAINITVTPSSSTWTVTGHCTATRTA